MLDEASQLALNIKVYNFPGLAARIHPTEGLQPHGMYRGAEWLRDRGGSTSVLRNLFKRQFTRLFSEWSLIQIHLQKAFPKEFQCL